MPDIALLFTLFAIGAVMLLAEIFIPSHGVLSIAGIGFLVAGVVRTFDHGRIAGVAAMVACAVFVPAMAYVSIKYWRRTPLGRRIVPPNPVLTNADRGIPIERLTALVGRTGRTVSPLRPVGTCEFDGRHVSCVTEFGMMDTDVTVVGTGIKGSNLVVSEKKT